MAAASSLPKELTARNGKVSWIALGITALSLGLVITQITLSYKQIKQIKKQESEEKNKLAELEMNLRAQLGEKYVSLGKGT